MGSSRSSRRKSSVLLPEDTELGPITVPPSGQNDTQPVSARDKVIDITTPSDQDTPGDPTYNYYDHIDFSAVFGDSDNPEMQSAELSKRPEDNDDSGMKKKNKKPSKAPEQRITLFALRLALVEKAASGIGTLSFLWATVVILGGFASDISVTDFWVVTVIILAEGSRIFSRSHELEWQSLSSKSTLSMGRRFIRSLSARSRSYSGAYNKMKMRLTGHTPKPEKTDPLVGISGDIRTSSSSTTRHRHSVVAPVRRPLASAVELELQRRTWSKLTVPLLPYVSKFASTQMVSHILYFVQLISAMLSIGLSIWRISRQPGGLPNISTTLNVFYLLSVLEAGLFLVERSYWEYTIRCKDILGEVLSEADLKEDNLEIVNHFFYDVYAQCLRGSIFDGLDMDLVSYSISWLQSDHFKQQLGGAKLLNRFVSQGDKRRRDSLAEDALRRLGTTSGIIERMVEMLSWDSVHEEELLREIATVICRLVVYNRNCSRLVAVPGAMDAVVSLLLSQKNALPEHGKQVPELPFELWLTGLRILKYLCKDHKNSLKIGETRGLLSVLVIFLEVKGESSFKISEYPQPIFYKNRLKVYKKSLQVLGSLAAATNTSGGILRKRIAAIVSGLKHLRDIIEHGDDQPELQRLAVEILYYLAMEEDVRKIIGATGGMIRNLFRLFARFDSVRESVSPATESVAEKRLRVERREAAEKAGEALTRLVLQNGKNCLKMLGLKVENSEKRFLQFMVDCLSQPDKIASSAAQILRSGMKFADKCWREEVAKASAPVVVSHISGRIDTRSEMYESCLGLGSRVLYELDIAEYQVIVDKTKKVEFVKQLIKNLKHTPTTTRYPSIRRYSVELILALIAKDESFLSAFQKTNLDLKGVLEDTFDSISEVENFCLFSGFLGYTRHKEDMEQLVERAIQAVNNFDNRSS